ncbi:MAG: tetratricopeptide repeat protein [Planctomycetes bacterium]|nr:tetratricopeptide repeat protein [Planctomycetota bacterium]
MRWQQIEFLLKGVYLGLLLLVALHGPSWDDLARVGAFTGGGLVLALAAAAYQKMREGYRPRGRPFGFLLFLILENPGLIYIGLISGLALGTYSTFKDQTGPWALWVVAGGAVLGLVFWFLRLVRDRQLRMWLGLVLAGAIIGAALLLDLQYPGLPSKQQHTMIGVLLLLGIPGFYLLTFASLVEESEVEIAAMCAALGVGLLAIGELSPTFSSLAVAIPLTIYFLYTRRVLPGLRVFKHTLRGLSYSKVGQYRPALASFNRALQLDPNYPLAQEQLWKLHREMDFDQLKNDPETLALVNYELCLERVAWLLLLDKPSPEQITEAQRLLDLVSSQKPLLEPRCAYWRSVAFLHQRLHEEAAHDLEALLRSDDDSPQRRSVLFQAWQLAIVLHPEMNRRVGTQLLAYPGKRMDAIAAVERQLAVKADDQPAWDLKRLLYAPLMENDYDAAFPQGQSALDFDHAYAQQLGLALIDDRERWQRGCEFLRIAARGLPAQAPNIYILIARTHEKFNDLDGLWLNYRRAMDAGRKAGPANLSAEDRQALFAIVKHLGDHARADGDLDTALDAYKFYSQNERSGVETYRTLADLFERKAERSLAEKDKQNNIWLGLNCVEHALSYPGAGSDPDLAARKDRFYYSITPEDLRSRLEQVHKWFDVDYCLQKTRYVLERYNGDLGLLDWASHLAELAQAAKPSHIGAKVLRARIQRIKGEVNEAAGLLEEIRQNKPEKFASEDEEESWLLAHRILGDMYLDEKPDQAVMCFQVFRQSQRAGADTMYKLGRAYENLGDYARAAKCFEQVLAFEGHPLYFEAQDGLDRVKRGAVR